MTSKDTVTSLTGRVKWFNNKAGYGFITVTDGSESGSDVFVHHSGINVSNQQYKYLVQGEYVNFVLERTESGAHEFHATGVNGINGGKLMCETRREFKLARSSYVGKTVDVSESEPKTPRSSREEKTPRSRGEGPRAAQTDEAGWSTVASTKTSTKPAGRGRGRPPRTAPVEAK
jgi:CspA family cold shock protein